jgi:hypothetical protein
MTVFIGFGHRSGHGKDTAAAYLRNELLMKTTCTVKIISFASKLKEIAQQMYGWAGLKDEDHYNAHREERNIKLEPIGLTPVEIWVLVGEKFREIYPPTWLDYVVKGNHNCDVVIIPDVRHPNEVDGIWDVDGQVCKITNPRVADREGISIDDMLAGFDDWDCFFVNDKERKHLHNLMQLYTEDLITRYKLPLRESV